MFPAGSFQFNNVVKIFVCVRARGQLSGNTPLTRPLGATKNVERATFNLSTAGIHRPRLDLYELIAEIRFCTAWALRSRRKATAP